SALAQAHPGSWLFLASPFVSGRSRDAKDPYPILVSKVRIQPRPRRTQLAARPARGLGSSRDLGVSDEESSAFGAATQRVLVWQAALGLCNEFCWLLIAIWASGALRRTRTMMRRRRCGASKGGSHEPAAADCHPTAEPGLGRASVRGGGAAADRLRRAA